MNSLLLRQLREEKHLTQKELGERIGVKPSSVSRYENGSLKPSVKKLSQIASVLNVDYFVFLNAFYDKPLLVESDTRPRSKKLSHLLSYEISTSPAYEHLVRLLIATAHGSCELCNQPAPFTDENGRPYLDVRLVDDDYKGEPDVKNLIALCPTCNRRIEVLQDPDDLAKIKEIASKHNY